MSRPSMSSPLRSAKTVSLTAGNFLTLSPARSLFVPFGKQSAPFLVSDGLGEEEGMLGKPPLVARTASFLTLLGEDKTRIFANKTFAPYHALIVFVDRSFECICFE